METTPEEPPTADAAGSEATKRRLAREMADEFLGRGAGIVRASIRPLGVVGRVVLIAGLVVWAAGPAPLWDNRPHIVFSLVALAVLAFPGVRLLRHRARMQEVLENLPTLLDNVSAALAARNDLGQLRHGWRTSGETRKAGRFGAVRRWVSFYRNDVRPLRQGPTKIVGQVTDLLEAFSAPALILSGIALLLGAVIVLVSPLAVLIRLIVSS